MQLMKDMPETVARFMGYLDKSLKEVVDEFVTDPRLFAVFTQLASYAGAEPADVASVYFLSMWNGYHNGGFYNFVGGSESISEALADVVRDNGGEVRVNTEATRIVLEEGRAKEVRTKDGSCFRARYVVSNATPAATVAMIGRESLPTEWVAAIDALKPGLPAFSVYLGVAHDYRDAFGDTHEIILQDSWDPHEVFLAGVECDPGRSMLLLITNYSVPDPTAAPAGKNVIVLTGLVGAGCHGEFAWGDHEAYKKVKDEVAAVFVDRAEAVMPGLRSHAEVIEVGSPKTMWAFSLNPNGTFAGAYPNVAQSVLNRTKQETPVPNLFLAGAWTFPGGGQQAVLGSGAAAARRILALEAATGRRPGSGSP
jgi:prolycopene isomerase